MAKGLPYFKFTPTAWLTGDISLEDFEIKGLFMDICAVYWMKGGNLTLEDVQKRYKKPTGLDSLIGRFIKITEGKITINFLDEQFEERGHISAKNKENGSKGGRPKGAKTLTTKPTANRPLTEPKPKKSQLEVEKEKEERIKLIKSEFGNSLKSFIPQYGEKMLREFFTYWSEPNQKKTQLKFQMQKTWDLAGRISTWKRLSEKNNQNGTNTNNRTGKPNTIETTANAVAAVINQRRTANMDNGQD